MPAGRRVCERRTRATYKSLAKSPIENPSVANTRIADHAEECRLVYTVDKYKMRRDYGDVAFIRGFRALQGLGRPL